MPVLPCFRDPPEEVEAAVDGAEAVLVAVFPVRFSAHITQLNQVFLQLFHFVSVVAAAQRFPDRALRRGRFLCLWNFRRNGRRLMPPRRLRKRA